MGAAASIAGESGTLSQEDVARLVFQSDTGADLYFALAKASDTGATFSPHRPTCPNAPPPSPPSPPHRLPPRHH